LPVHPQKPYAPGGVKDGGKLDLVVSWNAPPPAARRGRGLGPCRNRRPPPLDLFIRERVRPVFGVKNAFVRLTDIASGRPLPNEIPEVVLEACELKPKTAVAFTTLPNLEIGSRSLEPARVTVEPGPSYVPLGVPGQKLRVNLVEPGLYRLSHDRDSADGSYVLVSPHPYATTTDNEGAATLVDIPPGRYTLEVWHPPLKAGDAPVTRHASVEIKPGETSRHEIDIGEASFNTGKTTTTRDTFGDQ
jgi:hypothetical protein